MENTNGGNGKIKNLFSPRHYYGNSVRSLFLLAAVIIFLIVPLGGASNPTAALILIAGSVALTLLAGLTSPKTYTVAVMDSFIAGIGCFVFEWMAVHSYNAGYEMDWALIIFQALAIIFLIALYFSVKTIRGMVVVDNTTEKARSTEENNW